VADPPLVDLGRRYLEAQTGARFLAVLPNKRLKLAGAHKQGGIALTRGLAFLSAAQLPCARGQCARSLSAIR